MLTELSSKSSEMLLQIPNFTLFNECTKAMDKNNKAFFFPFHAKNHSTYKETNIRRAKKYLTFRDTLLITGFEIV